MDAAFASSQRRSVFVGNIPYDASEDQLVQICEEVGPVVSFRLMLDRETGRPKGYGFCEYKDEETALSARRNLQGYELNGRQLRINFAENDKGSDLGREQDRRGPGLISNNSNDDAQKPLPGPPVPGDSSLHQPMGLPLASSAASVMEKALGGSSLQNLSGLGNDPLTIYLSKISRHQLNDIMNEMKVLATQNKPLVRQLLQGSPQFSKALFQAQIMMGLVSQQMLRMAYERLSSNSVPQPSLKDKTVDQKTLPSYPGQIALQKEALAPNLLPNSIPLEQSAPPFQHIPVQPPLQHLFPSQCQGHPQGMMPGQSGVPTLQPWTPLVAPTSLLPHIQPLLLPHPRPSNVNTGHHPHLSGPSINLQQSLLSHPPTSQMCSTSHSVLNGLETHTKSAESSNYVSQNLTGLSRLGKHPNGLAEQRGFTDLPELINNPSKRQRLENGASAQVTSNNPVSGKSIAAGSLSANHQTIANPVKQLEKPMPQLPPDVESALVQQVLCLTREQLSSLPLDQQQQVFQLQQTIR